MMGGELLLPAANVNRLVITGTPLSGKSSLARKIAERYDLEYVSAGAIVAEMAEEWPALKDALKVGSTINSPRIDQAILARLGDIRIRGWIIDGFPRFINQYHRLFFMQDQKINGFIWAEGLLDRAIEYGKKRGRADDTEELIKRRWDWFETRTRPMYLQHLCMNVCPTLNFMNLGDGALEQTTEQFVASVQSILPSRLHRPH